MNKKEIIEEFLIRLRDKVKVNIRTQEAYLPLSVIFGFRRKKGSFLDFEGHPWILGAYTEDGLEVQEEMQNTPLYGHLYWTNQTVYLDKDFNVNNYTEHIIECPQCHQKYSDMFSNYAPNKHKSNSLCDLCEHVGFSRCAKDKNTCKYKNKIECKDCFFNGGILDPRMSNEDNESHLEELNNYQKLKDEYYTEYTICINNDNWFGTVGNKYVIYNEKVLIVKDTETGEAYKEFVEVKDDLKQIVIIAKECFDLNHYN